jgi:hypothetical protein
VCLLDDLQNTNIYIRHPTLFKIQGSDAVKQESNITPLNKLSLYSVATCFGLKTTIGLIYKTYIARKMLQIISFLKAGVQVPVLFHLVLLLNMDKFYPQNCLRYVIHLLPGTTSQRKSPSTETNGQSFLRRPGPTRGCRANDDDDDDDVTHLVSLLLHFHVLFFSAEFYNTSSVFM